MSKISNVGENPNDKMPAGVPLGRDEAAPDDSGDQGSTVDENAEDGLGLVGEDEDEDGDVSAADRENQASSEAMNSKRLQQD